MPELGYFIGTGEYTGDGEASQKITTGLRPKWIHIFDADGNYAIYDGSTTWGFREVNVSGNLVIKRYELVGGITIEDDGFNVVSTYLNTDGATYRWEANR